MSAGGEKLKVRVKPRGQSEAYVTGALTRADNAVDATSGMIRLAASFENKGEGHWPGDYVDVTLKLAVQNDAVVAPARAVQVGRASKYVYVIKPDNTVEVRPVTVRRISTDEVVVEQGPRKANRWSRTGSFAWRRGRRWRLCRRTLWRCSRRSRRRRGLRRSPGSHLMNLSEMFIRRPIMTTLVMASLLLFGVMAYVKLPVSDLPNVDMPTIFVTTLYPGASADTMAASVATPLEKQFSTIAGVDNMTSTSILGMTQVTLQFALTRNIDAAAQDVQAAITRAAPNLPTDLPTPPFYRKVNPADYPILYLALTSRDLPMSALDEYGETLLGQRISMVDGVAQVLVYGSQKYAVRIQVDPHALASKGIGIDEVARVITEYNVNLPTGVLNGPHQGATLLANGQLMEADSYQRLIVAYRNGQPVRLCDVGTAVDSIENDQVAAWYTAHGRRERSIVLAIQRQPGRTPSRWPTR